MRRRTLLSFSLGTIATIAAACAPDTTAPSAPVAEHASLALAPWGPETPPFNLEAILRAPDGQDGFGLVKFRQPNDGDRIVYLDVWARDLTPATSYQLQRATDAAVNDDCTGTNWLTLGWGTTPRSLVTDDRGAGRVSLFRNLAAVPLGTTFDIHFRLVDAATHAVVLTSGCYQFTVTR